MNPWKGIMNPSPIEEGNRLCMSKRTNAEESSDARECRVHVGYVVVSDEDFPAASASSSRRVRAHHRLVRQNVPRILVYFDFFRIVLRTSPDSCVETAAAAYDYKFSSPDVWRVRTTHSRRRRGICETSTTQVDVSYVAVSLARSSASHR